MSCKLIYMLAHSIIRLWFSQGCREATGFDVNMMRPPACKIDTFCRLNRLLYAAAKSA